MKRTNSQQTVFPWRVVGVVDEKGHIRARRVRIDDDAVTVDSVEYTTTPEEDIEIARRLRDLNTANLSDTDLPLLTAGAASK